jgi:hypothetical protein
MTDLTEAYAALQKADAAGDTAGARQLADYIRSQSGRKVQSYDAVNGQLVPTGSSAAVAARSPVADTNFGQNALIGAGKFFTDMGLGARQIYGQVADAISPQDKNLSGLITGQQPTRTATLQQEAVDKRAIDAPVMGTWGGKAGQIGAGVISAIPLAAIPGANTYAGAATIGGGFGALTPTTQNDSRLLNTGVGAGLGVAGKYAGDKLASWLASRQTTTIPVNELTPAQQQAAQAGTGMGMQLTPGQASGNKALQQFEAKLESQPWTSGPFNAIKRNNQEILNSQWAQQIGETGNSVDATVLGRANDRLGQVFDSVRDPSRVLTVNPQATTSTIDTIDQGVQGLIPGSIRDNALVQQLESVTSTGTANGEQLGSISSKLGKAAFKQMTSPSGDRDLGQALYAVKDHVDDLVEQTLQPSELAEYTAARGQYRNLMILTSRIGITNPSTGNISGANLANKLQQSDRQGFLFGRNQSDPYNAARFAQAFKPVVGDSGTATRTWNIADLPLGIPSNLATRLYLTGPGGAIARGAVNTPALVSNATASTSRFIAPGVQVGLPALGETSVPYLMQ